MILLLGFAFLAGLVTIAAPCIWPLLPIVLSSSATGKSHTKPLGVTLGIMVSFTIFTLAISYLVQLFHLDPNIIRLFAVVVLVFLGLSMIIPSLARITEAWVSRLAGRLDTQGQTQTSDFRGGFITGLSLGIVWTPCSGPILASIATLAATGQVSFSVILVTIAYVTGVGIPLFIFAYGGQRIIGKTRFVSHYTGRIQQVFGMVMLLTALAIYSNFDKTIQAKLLDAFPSYTNLLVGLERNNAVKNQLDALKGKQSTAQSVVDTSGLFNTNAPAPEFTGITKWLNTDHPLTLKELRGKVVLIDFWTYTCINCIRSLPHVTSWYDKYKDQGFVVIGVHTPEFEFEKKSENVLNAIKMYNIHYPVPQDNNYATWNAYNNQYWPAEYLIDAKGIIRRTHFGEGEYDQSEMAIQALLEEAGKKVTSKLDKMPDQTPHSQISPETYVGSKRMQYYFPNGTINNGDYKNLKTDPTVSVNSFDFGGDWNVMDEYSTTGSNAVLEYNFQADHVYLVMHKPATSNGTVKVLIDGKAADNSNAGADVKNGTVIIDQNRLYNLIDLKNNPGQHLLRLEFSPNIQVFAFTFG